MSGFKILLTFTIIFLMSVIGYAQKQSFDVVSFTAPKGWQQQQNEGGIQLSATDKKTGAYAIAIITRATASDADVNENFNSDWEKLIKSIVQVKEDPAMQEPVKENGWDIVSGTANYTDGEQKAVATLLTATGGGQMVSVVLLTNSAKYEDELLTFINSLEITKVIASTSINTNPPANNKGNKPAIEGLWIFYNTESSGYANGFPQLTGGYMRREYLFNADGTYTFRAKDWMIYVKDILFVFETGTYSVNGNQITLSPKTGKGQWWSKVPNNTKAWGKLVRASTDYKLQKTTYIFDFTSYKGNDEITLSLRTAKSTQRDGKDGDKTGVQEYRYKSRALNNSLIDNPPGLKTGVENKTSAPAVASQSNSSLPVAGIWRYATQEFYDQSLYPAMGGGPTGGYYMTEYHFNPDGTFYFLDIALNSIHLKNNILNYEKGTWTVNGNKLTITPTTGASEIWSKGSSWDKLLRTEKRILEKITYTFQFHSFDSRGAMLVMQYGKITVRDKSYGDKIFPNAYYYLPYKAGDELIELPKGREKNYTR